MFTRKDPKPHRYVDLSNLAPGRIVCVKAGDASYCITKVRGARPEGKLAIRGVTLHASDGKAPAQPPIHTVIDRYISKGRKLHIGTGNSRRPLCTHVVSEIDVYRTPRVSVPVPTANVPDFGVDLATLRKPGTIITLHGHDDQQVHITLTDQTRYADTVAYRSVSSDSSGRAYCVFVQYGTVGKGTLLSPFDCWVSRVLAPDFSAHRAPDAGCPTGFLMSNVAKVWVNGLPTPKCS